ncbi:MAG: hypothetical protein U1E15_11410 [Hyphomicrobiales bacterium]
MAGPTLPARLWALRTTRFSRLQKFALGLMVVGAIAAAGLPLLLVARHWRASDFMPVTATVTAVKPARSDGPAELRQGAVTLGYTASGLPQSVTLAANRLDAEMLEVGKTVPVFVNPNRLGDVETANTRRNIIMTLLFALAGAGLAVLGGLLFRWLTPELRPGEEEGTKPMTRASSNPCRSASAGRCESQSSAINRFSPHGPRRFRCGWGSGTMYSGSRKPQLPE